MSLDTKSQVPRDSLQVIGARHGTDKSFYGTVLPYYEKELSKYRDQEINVLEIGVFFGASLRMWREFFPKAQVYGLDHFTGHQGNGSVFPGAREFWDKVHATPDKKEPGLDRIHLIECDQSDRKSLLRVKNQFERAGIKFQFILDDASHLMKDQQQSLGVLWPLISSGGTFFMEDWGSSLDYRYCDVKKNYSNTTLTMMQTFNKTKVVKSEYMEKEEEALLTSTVEHPIFLFDQSSSTTAAIVKK
jgi:hypothetical protein